jgi:hypothetical protein
MERTITATDESIWLVRPHAPRQGSETKGSASNRDVDIETANCMQFAGEIDAGVPQTE